MFNMQEIDSELLKPAFDALDARKKSTRDTLIIRLHQSGRADDEIAEQVGVVLSTVKKVVAEAYMSRRREPV